MVVAGVGVVLYGVFGTGKVEQPARPELFSAQPLRAVTATPIPPTAAPVEPTPAPSDAAVNRMVIPKIGVDELVRTFYITPSGEMPEPRDKTIAWYDICGPAGCGDFSRPGFGGNAVFAAHVYWQNVPSTFFNLSKLTMGDEIQLRLEDGTLYSYSVIEMQVYPPTPSRSDLDKILGSWGREVVTLITCNQFNPQTRDYDRRLVVVAERIQEGPAPAPASRAP
jgi:LPXTG-site transpeptidase (sortase) family protein